MTTAAELAAKLRALADQVEALGDEPAPSPVPGPGPAFPSEVLDLRRWKLTLPVKDGAGPREVTRPLGLVVPPWFELTGDGGVRFRAPVNGVTTSGSKYPRSELRELNADGSLASWSSTSGTHTLRIVQAFTVLPLNKPHVVGGQIHDADNDVTVWRLEGSKLWVTEGDSKVKMVTDSYRLGTKFEAKYVVSGGLVQAYYNGTWVHSFKKSFKGAYWKVGCYTQANCSNSSLCNASNFGEVQVYELEVSHA